MNLFYSAIFLCGIQMFSLDVLNSSVDWVLVFLSIPSSVLLFSTVLKVSHVVPYCSKVSHAVPGTSRNIILSHGKSSVCPYIHNMYTNSLLYFQVRMKNLSST